MSGKQITIRVKVDGERGVRTFRLMGKEGEAALSRIDRAAIKSRAQIDNVGRSITKVSKRSGAAQQGMKNMAYQLNQVAQQGAVTGNYLGALAIQIPDMATSFGFWGILLGGVVATLPLLIDLLNLGGTSSKDLKDRMSELEAATQRYRSAAEAAQMPTAKLRDEFGSAAESARKLFTIQQKFERLSMQTAMRNARTAIAARFGIQEAVTEADVLAFPDRQARLMAANRPQLNDRGIDTRSPEQLVVANREIDNLKSVVAQLSPLIERVKRETGLSVQEASNLAAAFVRARDAQAGPEQIAALEGVIALYWKAAEASGGVSEEEEKILRALMEAQRAQIDFVAITEKAEASTSGAARAAGVLANEVSRAASAALNFVSNLGSANLAGIRAEVAALEGGGTRVDAAVARREAEVRASPEFRRAMQGPEGLQRAATDGLQAELAQTRERIEMSRRQTEALKALNKATGGSAAKGRGSKRAVEELTQAQRVAQQVISDAQAAVVQYKDVVAALDAQLNAGKISQETYNKALEAARKRVDDMRGSTDKLNLSFGKTVVDTVAGGAKMGQALDQLKQKFLAIALKPAEQALDGLFAKIAGNVFSGLLPSADGNVFAGGRVQAFANGGIVSRPTIFPMANGAGLMGEAGPEAIMPLKRGRGGKLGVVAQGAGGGVEVNVLNYSSGAAAVERRRGPDGREVINVIVEEQLRKGNYDGALKSRHGVAPAQVKR